MSKRIGNEQPPVVVKIFTEEEIDRGIEKLKRRIAEVEGLKPHNGVYNFQEVKNAESNIRETLRDVFGDQSPEYIEHQTHSIYAGRYNMMGVPQHEVEEGYNKGIQYTVTMLKGLISRLEEKKTDLHENDSLKISTTNDDKQFHPIIEKAYRKLFEDGHYDNAVFDASKALINYV